MRASLMRTLLGTLTTATMAISLGLPAMASRVLAASPSLILNEIDWAGSSASPTDQWVELYNPGQTAVDFAATPFHLLVNGIDQADLTSGTVPARGYFLISRLAADSPMTALQVRPDYVASLSLPSLDASYSLTDSAGVVVDRADDGQGLPFAGSILPIPASMVRSSAMADGTLPTSWMASHTVGVGLKASISEYSTPQNSLSPSASTAYSNPEVAAPSSLSVSPSQAASTSVPTVSGTASLTAGQSVPVAATVMYGMVGAAMQHIDTGLNPSDGGFSVTLPTLPAGLYRISASLRDAAGNVGAPMPLSIPGSPQNVYAVNQAAPALGTAPMLNATYPTLTNAATVTLTGTVAAGATVVVSVDGNQANQQVLAKDQTAFSLAVQLVANSVNVIEVRTQDASGTFSTPAIATVTQDATAPFLSAAAISVQANPAGMADVVVGATMATEANATVTAYADKAMTQMIGSTTAAGDGSFRLAIGDNQHALVYLSTGDSVGNVGLPLAVSNAIGFANTATKVAFGLGNVGTDQATLSIQPIAGAVDYLLKYRKASSDSFSDPIDLCMSATSCDLSRILTSLTPGTRYVMAIAAVDQFGFVTPYTEQSLMTGGTAPVVATTVNQTYTGIGGASPETAATPSQPAPSSAPSQTYQPTTYSSPTPTPQATASPSSTPVPTVSPLPSGSPEAGQVSGAENNGTTRNYTPWIILAVLLALAILATTGYFYWFGGEAGDEAAEAATVKKQTDTPSAGTPPSSADKVTAVKPPASNPKEDPKKPNDREKRW